MEKYMAFIPRTNHSITEVEAIIARHLALEDEGIDAKSILCSTLKFLGCLLDRGKEKRYFLSYERVGELLLAIDVKIVELAASVLFHATTPAISTATYGPQDMELKETCEVRRQGGTRINLMA